jgi:2-methylcitrate dehydratase PrpD
MSLARVIAAFAAEVAVPADAFAKAEQAMVDTIGCALAGADAEGTRILARVVARQDSGGPCTIIGSSRRAGPRDAALINGTAAHALDFDDVQWSLYGHPSVAILPTALALAEQEGASGAAMLEAFAIGVEVAGKIGRFANPALYTHGWHATSAIGAIGAAAAGGRLLKLDADRLAMAVGIAASMACGLRRNFGSMVKPFHAGRAAEIGVLAAELAREGFTADAQALEGSAGFFEVFNARSVPTSDEMTAALGAPWEIIEPGIVVKRYPSCAGTHCALDAFLALKEQHGFTTADIEAVNVGADPLALKILQHPRPKSGLEGKFSMQYCIAVAAVDGAPGLHHFTDRWIGDEAVRAFLPKVVVFDRTDLGSKDDGVPASVEVGLKDGRRLSQTVLVPRGDPRNAMSTAQLRDKFLDCARPALGGRTAAAYAELGQLRQASNLAGLAGLLAPAA